MMQVGGMNNFELDSSAVVAGLSADSDRSDLPFFLSRQALPAALKTGHPVLDDGHAHLLACIASLRRICIDPVNLATCGGCSEMARKGCEDQLVAMLGDLLAFVLDHFMLEAEIMRSSLLQVVDRAVCEAHMEDHAAISGKILEVVAALDPLNTVSRIRQLDVLLEQWTNHHMALHDMALARWVEREDSVLRHNSP